ncbi:MAG TPA: hypothetical protein VHF02_05915 [Luteimonas sp.]|nr:hypothetical protein [Luteimonas sp.]
MNRASLALAVLLGCGLGANALATQDQAVSQTLVTGKSLDKAAAKQSITSVGLQAINDAAAAAVIGALDTQFQDRDIQFKLGVVDSSRASLRDIALDGRGLIRLDGASAWMPIRFQALYDSDTQTVGSPSITFVAQHTPSDLDTKVAGQLDSLVNRKLAAEFPAQPVAFDLSEVSVVGGDTHYAVVQGDGIADFAAEGKSDVAVQGIYDRIAHRWVQVEYQLGGERQDLEAVIATR